MRAIIAFSIVLSAATLASCKPDNSDITGSIGECPKKLYSAYNPKDMKQCVAACIACDHGITTTCTTSCTLKGAH